MKRNLLLTPGPTQVPVRLCEVLGRPIIHHRTPQFQAYLEEALAGLQEVLRTRSEVYLLAGSGTAAMDAGVGSLTSPGDRVLTIEGGKFGERWTEICRAYRLEPEVISVPWGEAVDAGAVREALAADPRIKAVFATLCETSTGVDTDIAALGRVVSGTDAVLVVDAVSGLGVTELEMDAWGVDVVVSASHKGFMLPPGVACIAAGPRAQALMETAANAGYYLDLKKYRAAARKTDTPFTPAIGIIVALTESLRMMREQGIPELFAHYRRLASAVRRAMEALGLRLFAAEGCRSNVLTSVWVPEGIDGGALVKRMRDVHGVTIAGGQGRLKGKIFRMAHMGALDEYDILTGIACLEKVLKELGYAFSVGVGTAEAQKAFNEG